MGQNTGKPVSVGIFSNLNELKCKWHENFYCLCESPLKILKIAIYRSLISFLVPELLMFKDLQNGLKNGMKNARSGIKSIKIDKICDFMWWTSDSNNP